MASAAEAVAVSGVAVRPAAGERPGVGERIGRIWRHSGVGDDALTRRFDAAAFSRIEAAIEAGERRHRGEIRFALEARLDAAAIWRGQTPRQRALEVFAAHGIWDTEGNTGVLLHLLWADHAVEIVADRAALPALSPQAWAAICATLAEACRGGRPVDGVITAIAAIHEALARQLPADGRPDVDELTNRPIRL